MKIPWALLCTSFFLLLGLVAVPAFGLVPEKIHYQGYLSDGAGAAIHCPDPVNNCPSGVVNLEFKLYKLAEAGDVLWEESHQAVPVHNGIFHVTLGANTPITGALLNEDLLFLGLDVNDKGQLTPRQRFVSAAYALRAGHADYVEIAADSQKLGGIDAGQFMHQGNIYDWCISLTAVNQILTDGKYLTEDGAGAFLTDAGYLKVEEDPSVGSLNEGKWCRAEGGAIVCDQAEPTQVEASGSVKFGDSDTVCTADSAGTIRWTGTAFEGCDGNAWINLAHTGDTTLTEAEVDDMVSNNGFLTSASTEKMKIHAGRTARAGNGWGTMDFAVSYGFTFSAIPILVATPSWNSSNGAEVPSTQIVNITTSGATVRIYRASGSFDPSTTFSLDWFAMGHN